MSTVDLPKYVKAHVEFISNLIQTAEKTKIAVTEEIARCTRAAIIPIIQKEIGKDLPESTIRVVDNGAGIFNIFIHADHDLFSIFFRDRYVEVYRNGAGFTTIQNERLAEIP